MFKKKFFSFTVLIVLIIACVVLIVTLFLLSSVPAVSSPGTWLGLTNESGNIADEGENLPEPAVQEWELPIVVSITGTESGAGLAAAWGFDYGIKTVNEMGGIRNLPASITVRDTVSSNTEVAKEIEVLTSDSLVIMGPPTEDAFESGGKVFFKAALPAIGAAIDTKNRNDFHPFAISCITDPGNTAESVVATWVLTEHFTKVCILYAPANSERIESIERSFISASKEITEKIEIGNEAFDAATIADKAILSGAEAFYIDMSSEDTLRIITQLKFIAGDSAGSLKILCGPLAADMELIDANKEGDMFGVYVWTTIDPGKDVEKRKAYDEAFDKNVGNPAYRDLAIDYYQSALMLKQAIEALAIVNDPETFRAERVLLANWLFNSEIVHTEHGDFFISDGAKKVEAKLFKITKKGLQ